ncbi:MAG TPA: ribonuclease Z, partial [Spirochaetales bacterium]|nr:ribonuclease Z [Spirochaetales bacterium]
NLRWKKINAIFISHTHADHVTGLPGLLMLSSQVDRDEPLYIYGPPKIAEYVEENRRVLDMYINYEIIVKEIREQGICYEEEDFSIRAFYVHHTKPCVGYVLEEKKRPGEFNPEKALALKVPRGPLWSALQSGNAVTASDGTTVYPDQVLGPERSGRKFSFVTDTLYMPEIAPEVANSDLFVCEGMFEHALLDTAVEKKHMTALQAAMIAQAAGGIKKLLLIHYSPRYADKNLSVLLDEARSVFPNTELSKDRLHIPIEYVD